jgi:hypothetical protein
VDQKDKQVARHYQDKIAESLRADKAVGENEALKQTAQQLKGQIEDAKLQLDQQLQKPVAISTYSKLPDAADLLNGLKHKLPKTKASLLDVEVIRELLKGE